MPIKRLQEKNCMAITMDFEIYHSNEGAKPYYGVKELLELEDEAGIQKAVVMPTPIFRPHNKQLAEKIRGNDRFIGCANLNPHFGDEAVAELEQAVKEWNMKSLKLMPTLHGYQIDNKIIYPLMERARELNIPVNIHSGSDGCYPLQIMMLALDFPSIPIIMDHMGYRYYVNQAIAAARKCENIFLGTTLINSEPGMIKQAAAEIGADRIVFGSNCPTAFPVYAVQSLKRVFSGRELDLILGENLAKIYGVKS
jgi:hypothetical protein